MRASVVVFGVGKRVLFREVSSVQECLYSGFHEAVENNYCDQPLLPLLPLSHSPQQSPPDHAPTASEN